MDASVAASAADTAALDRWPRVADHPRSRGKMRVRLEDFQVDEQLGFCPTGSGEHVFLQIRKRGLNTAWVAAELARLAGLRPMDVGYAGLKDRHAVTTQWFSVYLRGKPEPDWASLVSSELEILEAIRHRKKLRPGALRANCFKLLIRELDGDLEDCSRRLARAGKEGVPNYFGEQRFGRAFRNLDDAERMFSQPKKRLPRHKRSLYLSAARSWLFNSILSERISAGSWNRRIEGDVFMLDGRSACFGDDASTELDQRLESGEIHPTAVMWGDGESMTTAECAVLESEIIDRYPVLRDGLVAARVDQQRRATRLMVKDLACEQDGGDMILNFSLQSGSYATMVLRELVECV